MPQRNGQRQRNVAQADDMSWDERYTRDEDWDRGVDDYYGDNYDVGRSASSPISGYNRPGGGRGYGRGDYGQGHRNRVESQNQDEWIGRGYGRGDYGQGSRNRADWDQQGWRQQGWGQQDVGMGRGYGRGDYGQSYGRNQNDWSYRSDQGMSRGEDNWRDASNRSVYNRGDYNQMGQEWDMDEPVTWTYTEWWLVPGPYTGRGPQGWQRPNERIKEDVCERLTQYGQLDASNVSVDVNNGEVTLSGTVNNRRDKRRAEDVVDSVPGVRDVNNQLRVQGDNNPGRSEMSDVSKGPNR